MCHFWDEITVLGDFFIGYVLVLSLNVTNATIVTFPVNGSVNSFIAHNISEGSHQLNISALTSAGAGKVISRLFLHKGNFSYSFEDMLVTMIIFRYYSQKKKTIYPADSFETSCDSIIMHHFPRLRKVKYSITS